MRILVLLLCFYQGLGADTIFEGYYKISRKNLHIGFTVMRIDQAPGTKAITITYFTRTFESDPPTDQAIAMLKISPTGQALEAKFTGMDDDTKTSWQKNFASTKEDLIFNNWLTRVMMANRPEKEKMYIYHALKESAQKILQGEIKLIETKSMNGHNINRLFSDYDGFPIEWWVSDEGEVLYTLDIERKIVTYLAKTPDEAIDVQPFNRSELTKYFKEIPEGKKNMASKGWFEYKKNFFPKPLETKFVYDKNAVDLKMIAPANPATR